VNVLVGPPSKLEGVPSSATLILGLGRVAYFGASFTAEAHAHHAVQLVVAEGDPFHWSANGNTHRSRVALIPAGVSHTVDASGTRVAVVLFERHGPDGARLDALAIRGLEVGLEAPVHDAVLGAGFPEDGASGAALLGVADRWTTHLLGVSEYATSGRSRGPSMSRESRKALLSMQHAIASGRTPRLTEVATELGLSPTRLTHRFTRELGIPFRALIPWMRVAVAAREMQSVRARGAEASLTRAAHAAGFVDAAHLTRTFRKLFGLPPSLVLSSAHLVGFEEWDDEA
jgi:AraC-like DNA-binding protein